ncbi:MAG: phosphatidate cytidylyltransferase [Saprospiraceae bacterium]|nr:phosphatidate cytidylyltransferase [Saprospiraceae bacterium]HMW38380.1 phosphatidate cytidylyltransferase [Saprospiraceae bacterium]HMX89543.1 phosphatidate cytidylyltransferase [Saprospiraceae bacterium]HMZ39771.1 phosphatidate cytidylyltransferase [Saprospiraceae bacterium]HNA63357.1 phosphatidate cytidylyltransferase [Saprospiraceae bacterium]
MATRIVTGLILGVVMLGAIWWQYFSASLLLLIIGAFSSIEWQRHFCNSVHKRLFLSAAILIQLLIFSSSNFYPCTVSKTLIYFGCGISILLMMTYFYLIKSSRSVKILSGIVPGIIYIVLPVCVAMTFLNADFDRARYIILSFIIINWSNDTMAYFGGRLFGKTPLAPAISPKKTLEGSLTGLVGGIIAIFILNQFFHLMNHNFALILTGTAIVVAGSLGDLYESSLKRMAGIKDSGSMLPGHGGFLDRFDSFFFVIPVGIILIELFN